MPFITDLLSKVTNLRIKIGDKLNILKNEVGQLDSLTTNDKSSLVLAVNEVNRKAVVHDGNLTINATNGLTGSGSFTANQQTNSNINIKIDDDTLTKINNGNVAHSWGSHIGLYIPKDTQGIGSLNDIVSNGIYREEQPYNAYPYTATLNMNSIDGRQQLQIDRGGNGMRFRGSTSSSDPSSWSSWKSVKTGHTRTVIVNKLSAGKYVGLRFAIIGIGPCKVVVTVQGEFNNANIGGSALVKEYCFHDNGDTDFYSQSSRSISAYGIISDAYRLSDGVYWNGSGEISCDLHGLPAASLGNQLKITIDYYLYDERNFEYISAWATPEIDDTSGIGKDRELALNDGLNTTGGTWKINTINSTNLSSNIGNGQIFNTSGGVVYWGNPSVNTSIFETSKEGSLVHYKTELGNQPIWTGHNFNPDLKANTTGNHQGLIVGNSTLWNGQTYTSVEFTGTPSWLLTYDISTDSWKPTSNITVSNWLRTEVNKVNPTGLKEATYGNWYGIVQEESSDNPTNNWYNKLKILHQNSYGYSTELAQGFTNEGIFYRSTVQGQTSNWTKLWDKNDFNDTRVSNWDSAYNSIGFPLSNLTTSDKTSLVGAVNEVNNIQIGGRNLLLNSKEEWRLFVGGGYGMVVLGQTDAKVGETFTASVFVRNSTSPNGINLEAHEMDATGQRLKSYSSHVVNDKVELTITTQHPDIKYVSINLCFNGHYSQFYQYEYSKEKLERGNQATDWTPAPEDQVSNWAETDSNSLSFIKGKEIVNNEFNNVYNQISSRANNRLSNLASDLTADEKRVIQDKTGAVSKTGDNVTPNSKWDNYSKGIYGQLDTDFWRIQGNLVSPNNVELELATADDATEAIVVRQYYGEFTSKAREAYLLDANGNTSFPEFVRSPKGFVTEYYDEFTIGQRYAQNIKFTEEQTLLNGFVNFSGEVVVDNGLRVGSLVSSGRVTATSFYESSLRKYKKNIKEYSNSALDIVKSLDVVTYDRTDSDISNKIGIIADDSHEDVLNEEKTAVDLYKTIFVLTKAVQELSEKVEIKTTSRD